MCLLLGASVAPLALRAQDDAPSLGDLARGIRQNKAQQSPQHAPDPLHSIIDNDNLSEVMEDAKNARPVKPNRTVFSVDAASNTLKVSSPDVTCNLSFNARAASLLIKPVLVEDLPLTELVKIDGPGSIQDDNLQLEVFNGTDWNLREITVGLTLERKPGQSAGQSAEQGAAQSAGQGGALSAQARVLPASQSMPMVPLERHSDVTLLYHLKAQAKPFSTTAFRENIGISPGPDEDWRWSIVEAKGIRPTQAPMQTEPVREEPLFATPALLQPDGSQQSNSPGAMSFEKTPAATTEPLKKAEQAKPDADEYIKPASPQN